MRWGGKMNNNMNFNWEKKISLKEIAQFYEDKLRELDAKEAYIDNKALELERKIRELKKETEDTEAFWKYIQERIVQANKSVIPSYVEEYLKQSVEDHNNPIYHFIAENMINITNKQKEYLDESMNKNVEVMAITQKEYLDNQIKHIQNGMNFMSSWMSSYTVSHDFLLANFASDLRSAPLKVDFNDFKQYLDSFHAPAHLKDLAILQFKSFFGDTQAKMYLLEIIANEVEK